jgi:transposase-like protein
MPEGSVDQERVPKQESDMTHEPESTVAAASAPAAPTATPMLSPELAQEVLQLVLAHGLDGLAPAYALLLNAAMREERAQALQAQPYERTEQRRGYANGFKPRTLLTRAGPLHLEVPQVRGEVDFYPSALERGQRSERALLLACAEMYVQGVATRRVEELLERLCGRGVSSSTVSRATARLDPALAKWRTRPIGPCQYVVLDARYEKVRRDGAVRSAAVLIATAVNAEGRRQILGVSVSLSEAEVHWRAFLRSLKDRGLCGVMMVTSDDHPGLKAALTSVFPGAAWQRCQCHLQRNATAFVPQVAWRAEVAQDLRGIFNAPSRDDAQRLLDQAVAKYEPKAAKLAAWLRENVPDGFAVFALPPAHRRLLRTTNSQENLNRQVKRRTRVACVFPNEASLLRLVSAVLAEISDEWEADPKQYLVLTPT